MTQPIQEPNTQRSLSQGRWAENQLFRRPPPFLGTVWPWLVLVNGGQTLPGDNSERESLFTEAYWDPAITSDPTVGGGVFFIDAVDDGEGNDYWQLTLKEEGWYDFDMAHEIEEATTDGGANVFFTHQMTFSGAAFDADTPSGGTATWTASGPELAITPWLQSFRRLWIPQTTPVVATTIKQNSTVDKGVGGHLKVFYLAGVGGGTQNTDWELAVIT